MRRTLLSLAACTLVLARPPQARTVLPQGARAQRLDLDLALLARAARELP